MILSGLNQDTEPIITADEVIREIDDMMQEDDNSLERSPDSEGSLLDGNEMLEKGKQVLSSPLYEDSKHWTFNIEPRIFNIEYFIVELKALSLSQLNELYLELEVLIREFSETLIAELALRDELEYEKELKNTFISLLLAVQNKRRQYHVEKKRSAKSSAQQQQAKQLSGLDPKVKLQIMNNRRNKYNSW